MTATEMKSKLQAMTSVSDDGILTTYLDIAGDAVLKRRYQNRQYPTAVPPEYQMIQLKIAAYLVNKRGAEGQTAHNENGINRTYESGDIPMSMLRDVVPLAKALGGGE